MIIYTTGDLLKSSAEALVNTVNCEGYMGKGIAYQFKLKYPENNVDYIKACKSGELQVGKLHHFKESGKIIVNFPTKNKWREKSRMEYIEDGLESLVYLVGSLGIRSIAIPPLGSGNGGLIWSDVKKLIEEKLSIMSDRVEIYIYEPSRNYVAKPVFEPKLSVSALILIEMKKRLNKFDTLRLQKTAYFMNIFSNQKYFRFKKHKYGPYDNSIAIVSRKIREFQEYHDTKNSEEAYKILYDKIVSEKVDSKLLQLVPHIEKASIYVNSIRTNHELECLSTILFLAESTTMTKEEIVEEFRNWSEDKANRFSEKDILDGIEKLRMTNIIEETLTGYIISMK